MKWGEGSFNCIVTAKGRDARGEGPGHRWLSDDSAAAGAQLAGAAVASGWAAGPAGAGALNASMPSIR